MRQSRTSACGTMALLACALIFTVACSGGRPGASLSQSIAGANNGSVVDGGDQRAGSIEIDGFAVQIMDRSGNPISEWNRLLTVQSEDTPAGKMLTAVSNAERLPDNLFFNITYDETKLRYTGSDLSDGATGYIDAEIDVIKCAMQPFPGRVDFGIARVRGGRGYSRAGASDKNKPIFILKFERGLERLTRRVANAPQGEVNLVTNLAATDLGDNRVELRWTERNVGDYDGNGEVGVPDITPIANHYLETLETADDINVFELIDGDDSNDIGVPDITPIAQNYLNSISGYQVYRDDTGDTPLPPGSATMPTMLRPTPLPEQGALEYVYYDRPPASGQYTYTVRAFSSALDDIPLGDLSNEASVEFTAQGENDVTPPAWEGGTTAISAESGASSVQARWGRAVDDESPPVDYLVYVSSGDTLDYLVSGAVFTVQSDSPDPADHKYVIDALPAGGPRYTLGVRARDRAFTPNIDTNMETVTIDLADNIGWLDMRGGAGRTGAVGYPLNPPLIQVFQHQINPAAIQSNATPAIVGRTDALADTAICAIDGTLYALDLTDDLNIQERWTFPTAGFIDSSPAVRADRVFFGSRDNKFYCVDLQTGEEEWWFGTAGVVTASPVVVDDIVWLAVGNGDIFGLSIFDGGIRYAHTTDSPMSSSPAVFNEKIYVGAGNSTLNPGSVICYDPVSDTRAWTVSTAGGVTATPAVADERVMAGDLTGNFYIITTSGALLYTLPLDGGVRASPCYANGIAYVATLNRKVYAINVASGTFAWPQPATVSGTFGVISSPLLSSNYLYVAGSNGNISAIDIVTGNVVWEWTSGTASITSSVVAWGPRIYMQDNGNMLRAFSANYDDEPPFWVSDVGITNVEWTGSLGQPRLRLTAGDAFDLETPPVKWLFYMSDLDAVDFANPGGALSSTITFGPYPASITTFTVPEMNRARARWDAHRAWYAARAGDGAIPSNYEGNETTIDYTFPWVGETPLHTYGLGEAAYQFDAAYDESEHTFLTASFELAGSEWKLMQRSPDESPPVAIRLLPLSSFAGLGYLDIAVREVDDGMGGFSQTFYLATAVPIDGDPIRRELWVGQSQGSVFDFEMEKIDSTDHNWGEVSVAIDNNGRPAVACTYMVDITEDTLVATFYPRYHYLDDNDPPIWQHEFIDQTGKQTWYVDLEFKSDGTPVVAYTKSNSTFGGNTGLFVAERNGVDPDPWTITPVAGGDLLGTIGKHLSMVLDENDHPVILYTDLQEGMFKLALPTSDGEWNIVDIGVVGNQGRLIHHGTDLVKIDGGTLGTLYVAGHFSQPGASRTYQYVFVRAFYKSGANWIVPTDNAYWLTDAEQAMDDSSNIVLVERGRSQPFLARTLNVLFAGDFGKQLLVDSVQSPNILK